MTRLSSCIRVLAVLTLLCAVKPPLVVSGGEGGGRDGALRAPGASVSGELRIAGPEHTAPTPAASSNHKAPIPALAAARRSGASSWDVRTGGYPERAAPAPEAETTGDQHHAGAQEGEASEGQEHAAGAQEGEASEGQEHAAGAQQSATGMPGGEDTPWWVWPLSLFILTFLMGILAALGGVGGGVLYVPIVSGFFPFHLDFVRGAGLLVALSGALAAGPGFLRMNLASLRLAMPVALIASTCAIAGAMVGLSLPTNVTQTALGATILGIVILMITAKKSTFPDVPESDRLSSVLGIYGIYTEASLGRAVNWKVHRTLPGLILFIGIGFAAGMFGLGAGWANVPVLNLVMGAPLKISVATSKFLLSITDTSAAWIYMNQGCVIPMMVVPSLVGIMLGSFIGVRILRVAKPTFVRWIVIVMLLFAGAKAITKGLGLPFIV